MPNAVHTFPELYITLASWSSLYRTRPHLYFVSSKLISFVSWDTSASAPNWPEDVFVDTANSGSSS